MRADRHLAVVATCVLVVLAGCSAVVPPDGDGPETNASDANRVDSCTTITEPGRYELAGDITDAGADQCIRIKSSDVTFDGGGHAVDGVGEFGTAGVIAGGGGDRVENVTVRNVAVSGWDDGIRYVSVTDGRIEGTTTEDNRIGTFLVRSSGNVLADNAARENAVHGISLADASDGNRLVNNTAAGNTLFGVHLVGGATDNRLVDNVARGNEMGVALIAADGNEVRGTAATGNRIGGVWLSAANDTVVADNEVSNRFYGIVLMDGSGNNTIAGNAATENQVGVRLHFSPGNAIENNTASENRAQGILLISSAGNRIANNTVTDNGQGISLIDSGDAALSNNVVRGNERAGIAGASGGSDDESNGGSTRGG
ncbi:right-handed parallel beta-helix repeat-containing protein [Halegenticoccus tardaugens]|uniref:right-handed parallel beta-helix repeat-containing protein n=1 Tax=Halegenticoccus tardaugens TaxID=2071624 RepID=UPI00100AB620|nr:NosD domain-containing protein [Halegenticoccus tardaugens]